MAQLRQKASECKINGRINHYGDAGDWRQAGPLVLTDVPWLAMFTPMERDLAIRLEFLQLRGEDVERLSALRSVFERRADHLVSAFYRHLLSFAQTRELLKDSTVCDRLLLTQRSYLLSLCDAKLDEDYVADRRMIGRAHVRVGLEPRWYFGAYALYFSLLAPDIVGHFGPDVDRAEKSLISLQRILMLDAQLAMESYSEAREANLGQLAEHLAKSERGLAQQVDEQKVKLRSTTERARAAERLASVGAMAAGLAHEIGTPMGIIRGHAELLEAAVEGEAGRERLRTIVDQIDRISNIMQGLLNLARPGEPERERLSLTEVVDTVVAFLSDKAERAGVEVVVRHEEIPDLMGDRDRLQQLLLNLILNAFDAMVEGGRLEVGVSRADPRHVRLRIADNGMGIKPRDLPEIFNPFFTSKLAGQGNGLGLVVAQGIARDHGGQIEVESEVGVGTEFQVHLPI